jgi:hypothetical protein
MSLSPAFSKTIESFALDFVRLIRGVRVYPSKHPALIGVAVKVLASLPFDSTGTFTMGVTPTELIVSGEFIAGKTTRLSSFLHGRKILRIYWTREVRLEDLWTFARLLSTPRLEGDELRRRLQSHGVYAIDLEPLALEQIHRGVSDEVVDLKKNSEERRRNAWFLLLSRETSPDQIASALGSDEFWVNAKAHWTEAGYGDSEGFTDLLIRLEERFEAALSLLPDARRKEVLDYLAKMGETLSTPDLVRILSQEGQKGQGMRQGVASLFRKMDGERLADLLAGLVATGDRGTRRMTEIYHRFSSIAETEGLLSLVKSRLSLGEGGGFTVEVWKTVEKLILELDENPFVDSEYSESLGHLLDAPVSKTAGEERSELLWNPDTNLDNVLLGLAAEGDARWRQKLLERLEIHTEQLDLLRALQFVRFTDEVMPDLLDSVPPLIKNLFRKGMSHLSKTTPVERQVFAHFIMNHEGILLDTALKALAEEERISARHFLVTLLSSFSSAATPAFVAKARKGPWYVTRNLAIVLGQQGLPCSLPTLRALSNHDHPKVRREALRALRNLECLYQRVESRTIQETESQQQKRPMHFLPFPAHGESAGACT